MACLVALATATVAIPCRGQSTGAVPAPAADTTGPGAPAVRNDSAAASPGDSVSAARRDSAAPTAVPSAAPAVPVDSVLGAACKDVAGGGPDLLLVTFRSTATAAERDAVARDVGGTVVGTSEHAAPGAWYLRVPGAAHDRLVADRLIRLSPVLGVGTTGCPS
jgi:hypothetical protein